jgi:hypothetical protein
VLRGDNGGGLLRQSAGHHSPVAVPHRAVVLRRQPLQPLDEAALEVPCQGGAAVEQQGWRRGNARGSAPPSFLCLCECPPNPTGMGPVQMVVFPTVRVFPALERNAKPWGNICLKHPLDEHEC